MPQRSSQIFMVASFLTHHQRAVRRSTAPFSLLKPLYGNYGRAFLLE
jgi:hypothetical protein